MKQQHEGKVSQPMLIAILIVLTFVICFAIWTGTASEDTHAKGEHAEEGHHEEDDHEHANKTETETAHAEEGEIQLTQQQLQEHDLKIETVEIGFVEQMMALPGKLVVNTDQQAHVSPNFSGHVEQVTVALGQPVQRGQTLAVLSVPELIDQHANLRLAQAQLDLARQDYQREQQLWSQGISAKQDYLRAENSYRQAQISVQSAQARLTALGTDQRKAGQFIIRAPISGVISQKDIVVGENVQLADQLFVIEQLKDVWLEFNLPSQFIGQIQNQQLLQFKANGIEHVYEAMVQSLTSQADAQTGALVVRAKLKQHAAELRPNVMVNVLLPSQAQKEGLRVKKTALQRIEGQQVVFLVETAEKGQIHLKKQAVTVGQQSSDGQWVAIESGLKVGQSYISQGSFVLKSELEKDEAGHEH